MLAIVLRWFPVLSPPDPGAPSQQASLPPFWLSAALESQLASRKDLEHKLPKGCFQSLRQLSMALALPP